MPRDRKRRTSRQPQSATSPRVTAAKAPGRAGSKGKAENRLQRADEPALRGWANVGRFPFDGHEPGEIFDAAIPPERAARLIAAHVLQPVKRLDLGRRRTT